jgi:alpha-glucosidase
MADIPYANQLAQLNLLDSHDTPRLLSEVDGSLAVMQLAVTMLFTWPGVPCIYYGDEIGLAGGPDPDCRRCFDWDRDHWAEGLWTHYQTLARSRRARTEWQSGAMLWMGSGADWLAYARFDDRRASIVIVNRGPGTRITLPLWALPLPALHWRSLGGVAAVPAGQALEIDVPAQCSRILTGDAG